MLEEKIVKTLSLKRLVCSISASQILYFNVNKVRMNYQHVNVPHILYIKKAGTSGFGSTRKCLI